MPAFHSELNIQSARLRKLAFMLVPSDPNNYAPLGKAVNLGHLPFVTAVTHAFRLGFLKAFLPLQFGLPSIVTTLFPFLLQECL